MSLKETLQADMIASMKAGEKVKTDTLKMLKAAIMKWEVSGAKKEADDEIVLGLLAREIKMRKEAAEGFRKGAKEELALKEEQEAAILQAYMPEQMSEEEVKVAVAEVLKESGFTAKADMGKAMAAVMAKLKGKADGKVVNQTVAALLQ